MANLAATFSKWLQPSFGHPDEGSSTVVTFKRGYQALDTLGLAFWRRKIQSAVEGDD